MKNKTKTTISIIAVALIIIAGLCIPFTTAYINPSSKLIDNFSKVYSSISFESTPEQIDEILRSNLKVIDKRVNEYAEKYTVTYKISGHSIECVFSDGRLENIYFCREEAKYGSEKVCYETLPLKHKEQFEKCTDAIFVDEVKTTKDSFSEISSFYQYDNRPMGLYVKSYDDYFGDLKLRSMCAVTIRMDKNLFP